MAGRVKVVIVKVVEGVVGGPCRLVCRSLSRWIQPEMPLP
jgi:hypothetical protein